MDIYFVRKKIRRSIKPPVAPSVVVLYHHQCIVKTALNIYYPNDVNFNAVRSKHQRYKLHDDYKVAAFIET